MVKCFVVGCSTGYKSAKENDAKVFKPPKEERQFILWGKKMERSDRKFSIKDHVCSRHFKEEIPHQELCKWWCPIESLEIER